MGVVSSAAHMHGQYIRTTILSTVCHYIAPHNLTSSATLGKAPQRQMRRVCNSHMVSTIFIYDVGPSAVNMINMHLTRSQRSTSLHSIIHTGVQEGFLKHIHLVR